eukprot:8222391-Heterocapsa_arctica.AAC.1
MDANAKLAYHNSTSGTVGPLCGATSNNRRAEALLFLLLDLGLAASNSYPRPGEDIESWTHKPYNSTSTSTIDYICVQSNLVHESFVNYDLDCQSDHKPIVCTLAVPLPGSRLRRPASVRGWRPRSACDS